MTIGIGFVGLMVAVVLLALDKYIKNYPFDKDDIDTVKVVVERVVLGILIVKTLSVFLDVTVSTDNMGECYVFCYEYWDTILIGSFILLVCEILPLFYYYRNLDIKGIMRRYAEKNE